jgi:hypothetical protein
MTMRGAHLGEEGRGISETRTVAGDGICVTHAWAEIRCLKARADIYSSGRLRRGPDRWVATRWNSPTQTATELNGEHVDIKLNRTLSWVGTITLSKASPDGCVSVIQFRTAFSHVN